MTLQFNDGDLVQLKSGGPIMTVINILLTPPYTRIFCYWFDVQNCLHEASFPDYMLEKVKKTK